MSGGAPCPETTMTAWEKRTGCALIEGYGLSETAPIVIANPVPESAAMDSVEVDRAIHRAIEMAAKKGVRGKEITPFLLESLDQITGGACLKTNIALVTHNAQVGAQIAGALARPLFGEAHAGDGCVTP